MGQREKMSCLAVFLLLCAFSTNFPSTSGWPLIMEDLTEEDFVLIDELRALINYELPEEYMEQDWYLAKWLAAQDFNVSQAADMLLENLKWRKEHKLTTILEEDWSYMEHHFPYERNTTDVYGRPILYFYFGMWDIHKLITEEDSLVTLGRYMTKIVEESDRHVRSLRGEDGTTGPNQFQMIINFDGYDIWNQGCFQCLAFYRGFGQTLESHFPRSVERVVLLNVPAAFEVVFWYVEAVLREKTRLSVTMFGPDRRIWEPALLTYVERNQIPGDLVRMPMDLDSENGEPVTTTFVLRQQQNFGNGKYFY